LPAPVATITNKKAEQLRSGRSTPGSPAAFAASLDIEQADLLLRQTDQYAQWQRLRQKNDDEAQKLVPLLLARNIFLQESAQGKSINWQEFDRLTAQLGQSGIKLPSSQDIQSKQDIATATKTSAPPPTPNPTDAEETSPAAPADTLLNEEFLLILNAVCPVIGLKQEILGYGDGESTLLPLGGVARTLDFDVKVDTEKKTATGWFITEDRTLSVNANNRTVTIGGTTYPWPDGKIVVAQDDIYVDSAILSQWFPVDFAVSTGEMALTITPREKLPIQAQYEREKKRKGLLGKEDMSIQYPIQESPYELFSFPIMDVSLQSGMEGGERTKSDLSLNHSLVAEGDLGRMGTKVFLGGNEEDPLNNARITLERVDRNAQLLGPMRASKVAVGDVSPVTLPILGSSEIERGVAVSNGDILRSRDFDTTRFEGNTQPGWDVELYQNGNLIESVRVGGDGRYRFEDVPVYFGVNAFQLLTLGPQGQRRMIETKDINVGAGMLKAGKFEYNLSATQQKNTVLGLSQDVYSDDERESAGNHRVTGRVAYGLTDKLSATAGVSSVEFDDTRHNYMQAGLSGAFSSLYGELNTIHDSAGGSGHSLQGQTALGPFNLRAKHEIFSDFIDEDNSDKILEERTSLSLNGRIPESFLLPPLSYTLSKENTTYTDSENDRYRARLSGRVQRVNLSNTFNWNDRKTGSTTTAPVDGEFKASGSIGRVRLIAGLDYDLGEEDAITRYTLSGLYSISRGISAGVDLTRDAGKNEKDTARFNLNLDTGKYTFTPSLSYDSEGEYRALLGLSFSLGQDPVSEDLVVTSARNSGKGSATALVYHDANNNKVFDQDEPPLPEVKVVARQARKTTRTNETGVAQITGLVSHTPTEVAVDPESLQDPSWLPSVPGVAVAARTGSVNRLEFPVVTTGEIDGVIFYENSEGIKEPLANARLELQDDKGALARTAVSEYDGFYLFEKVMPGTYTLRVRSEDPRIKEAAAGWQGEVAIGNDGTIARGNDILLRSPEAGKQKPAPVPTAPPSSGAKKPEQDLVAAPSKPVSSFSIRPLTIVDSGLPLQPSARPEQEAAVEPKAATLPGREEKPVRLPSVPSINIAPLELLPSLDPLRLQPAPAPLGKQGEGKSELNGAPQAGIPLDSSKNVAAAVPAPSSPTAPPVTAIRQAIPPTVQPGGPGSAPFFGVHLASYTSMETARAGLRILSKRLAGVVNVDSLAIVKVHLGKEKGDYYRVISGRFGARGEADQLASRLLTKTDYAQPVVVQAKEGASTPGPTTPARRVQAGLNANAIAGKYAAMQQTR